MVFPVGSLVNFFDKEWRDQPKYPGSRAQGSIVRWVESAKGLLAEHHKLSAVGSEPLRFMPLKER